MIHLHFAFSVDFCGYQSRQSRGSCQPYEPSYWSETLKKMASSTASWCSRWEEKRQSHYIKNICLKIHYTIYFDSSYLEHCHTYCPKTKTEIKFKHYIIWYCCDHASELLRPVHRKKNELKLFKTLVKNFFWTAFFDGAWWQWHELSVVPAMLAQTVTP